MADQFFKEVSELAERFEKNYVSFGQYQGTPYEYNGLQKGTKGVFHISMADPVAFRSQFPFLLDIPMRGLGRRYVLFPL